MFHQDQCLAFAACRKAAISPVTFGLGVNGVLRGTECEHLFPIQ